MLRQLNSHQLAEMYAYYHVELVPETEEERAAQRAQAIQAMFARAAQANDQRSAQFKRMQP